MARVTSSEVQEVIPTSIDVTPFIDNANEYVTDILSGKSLGTAKLTRIELYVAAHLVALRVERGSPRYEQMGNSRMSWDTEAGPGLLLTRFGQAAIMFDTSGTLATKASSRPRASFRVF